MARVPTMTEGWQSGHISVDGKDLRSNTTYMWGAILASTEIRISSEFDSAASTTAGIQEAIDALPAAGGEIYIPAGTHSITAPIVVNKPCTIRGAGQGVTIIYLADDSNQNPFTLPADQTDVTIRDLTIDGNQANNATDGEGIYCTDGNLNCLFENLEIQNCRENGISIDYAATPSQVNIKNCYIHDCQDNGIRLNTAIYCIIEGCHCTSNVECGIYTRITNNSIINDNICNGNAQHGIAVQNSSVKNVISNNECCGNTQEGIFTGTGTDYCTFSNNICSDNVRTGIYLLRSDYCIVVGNVCDDNGAAYDGIHIHGTGAGANQATNNIVANNICTAQKHGIYIDTVNAVDTVVIGNVCLLNTTNQIEDDGTDTKIDHNVTV